MKELKFIFNTSTEASVAVDMVEGAECKRERGHRSFAGDETFPFLESESSLNRWSIECKFCVSS